MASFFLRKNYINYLIDFDSNSHGHINSIKLS